MFFSLIFENAAGDKIDMTATAKQYMTSQIEGLSPPLETISTSNYAGNLVIHFMMRGVGLEAYFSGYLSNLKKSILPVIIYSLVDWDFFIYEKKRVAFSLAS